MKIFLPASLCAAFGLVLCLAAGGPWQRVGYSSKGAFRDTPEPHPLSYFIADAFLRDDGNDFCYNCAHKGQAEAGQRHSIHAEIKPLGDLAGYHILDALYSVSPAQHPDQSSLLWKFILVQVAPDLYREIFHLQSQVPVHPSHIVQVGSERVLVTMDRDQKTCWEGYWWFDRNGPHALNFSLLVAAIHRQLPQKFADRVFEPWCSTIDWTTQKVEFPLVAGDLTARFKLHGPIVEPVGVVFKPRTGEVQ